MKFLAIFILCLVLMAPVSVALAQGDVSGSIVPCGNDGNFCTLCDLVSLAQNLINIGIFIAITLSAVTFAVAGIKYMSAGGDPGKATDARKMFTKVVVGLVIILGAWVGVDTLMKTVLDEQKFGPWNSIGCSQTAGFR
ncbi:MAG: hypothetical protein HYT30_00930 [Parcubacteria group bacterium]|nr:hypothetical protein [Parcubacteria group bacterium]